MYQITCNCVSTDIEALLDNAQESLEALIAAQQGLDLVRSILDSWVEVETPNKFAWYFKVEIRHAKLQGLAYLLETCSSEIDSSAGDVAMYLSHLRELLASQY